MLRRLQPILRCLRALFSPGEIQMKESPPSICLLSLFFSMECDLKPKAWLGGIYFQELCTASVQTLPPRAALWDNISTPQQLSRQVLCKSSTPQGRRDAPKTPRPSQQVFTQSKSLSIPYNKCCQQLLGTRLCAKENSHMALGCTAHSSKSNVLTQNVHISET